MIQRVLMSKYLLAFSTTDSKNEASKIAKALVKEGLAAGVNIVPSLRSIYKWKGALCDKKEFLLIITTTARNQKKLKTRLKDLHHYDCPELVFITIKNGLSKYLSWIDSNTTK